jgi:PAS domain S-box-containing protein
MIIGSAAGEEGIGPFHLLFSTNPLPMWVADRTTLEFLEVNDTAIRHYGYSREEFLGMRLTDIRPIEEVERLVADVGAVKPEWRLSAAWKHRLKSGELIDVEVRSRAVTFKERPGVLVVAMDVSERHALQAQLRQAQKLETIGQLVGSVAHDLNNILTAILGFSELAISDLPSDHSLQGHLGEIQQAGNRAANLTTRLLAFGRKQLLQPRVLDVNEVVRNAVPMLRRLIFEHVELAVSLSPDMTAVTIDPTQLEQILVNLAVNARDAMPHGGTLTIQTASGFLDGTEEERHLPVLPGEYAMLIVSDTGMGIDASTRARIFEPFFTTKQPGKGTGLGLSTVYGIVRENGGGIAVRSAPGRGTTFTIYLPQTAGALATSVRSGATGHLVRGTETILLVEDDEAVRLLALATLRHAGYRVLHASNPRRAMEVTDGSNEPIHLLLSDVVMPESDGPPLFQMLAGTHPALRVLYMSGHADDVVLEQGIEPQSTPFINKPFTPQTLTLKIREVLDAPPPSIPAGAGSLLAGKA